MRSLNKTYRGSIGVSHRRNLFVVDNANGGFDLRDLGSGGYLRTFPTGRPTRRLPKQVAFGERTKVIVGGSDHGNAYVFDQKTGVLREVLHHQKGGLVQTIAVRESYLLPG